MLCWPCCRTGRLGTNAQAPLGGSLSQWLAWQQQLHSSRIDLGLDRVGQVFAALQLDTHTPRIMTVAGTNGKGSCVHAAQALARSAGLTTGAYTSPHLWRYNERIQINGEAVDDNAIVAAFEAIEACRNGISLSYFEYGTLAALYLFDRAKLDFWVLEVGLGGRLDAVNIVDADVAVVTSIGLDHQDWLGSDVDVIAQEKAAIARPGKALFLGPNVPAAAAQLGRDVGAQVHIWSPQQAAHVLPEQQLPTGLVASNLQLAALALQALKLDAASISLQQLQIPGRCQRIVRGDTEEIFDVAHNLDAMQHLADYLSALPKRRPVAAVFSVLADKAVEQMVQPLLAQVDIWCLAPLDDERAMAIPRMLQALSSAADVRKFANLDQAMAQARQCSQRIVVCGSFFTVAAVGQAKHG